MEEFTNKKTEAVSTTSNIPSYRKKPRGIVLADNWKKKEIQVVLNLRDEMIENNIDEKLIKSYLDEQYAKIDKEYNLKIQKYNEKNAKSEHKQTEKNLETKRKKAISLLAKNKLYMEQRGAKPEEIKKFLDREYEQINKLYSYDPEDPQNINIDRVNFID